MNPASPSPRAIAIGADSSEQLSIHVTRREFPEASDYWDGNWVYATIQIRAGAFRGEYEALLRTDELASFRDQLATLHAALNGSATFETMEHWLRVDIQGDGRGHFLAHCEARDQPGLATLFASSSASTRPNCDRCSLRWTKSFEPSLSKAARDQKTRSPEALPRGSSFAPTQGLEPRITRRKAGNLRNRADRPEPRNSMIRAMPENSMRNWTRVKNSERRFERPIELVVGDLPRWRKRPPISSLPA